MSNLSYNKDNIMSAKILIIDDDERLTDVYSMALRVNNYEVDHISSGKDSIEHITKSKPDLIILDAMMPGASGVEVLGAIRNTPSTKNTKVIMFTALSDERMKKKILALGVSDYIVKSQLTISQVVEDVSRVLSEVKS